MNEQEFQQRLHERASRYPGWDSALANYPIHIRVEPKYAATYAGQVAVITAASLFGRMSKAVSIEVPSLTILSPLPWATKKLDDLAISVLSEANPHGNYAQRAAQSGDLRITIGPQGDGLLVHGCGWTAYCGTKPSPIPPSDEPNPFGAAFAVITAAAQLQQSQNLENIKSCSTDTYLWKQGLAPTEAPKLLPNFELGELWSVGVGSVGCCALFFLGLVTQNFRSVLIDDDIVKIENITRSALFSHQDTSKENPKVEVVSRWLRKIGVQQVEPINRRLDEILDRWVERPVGTPDILISAANEQNVRSIIEGGLPPLQIYATTGRNWQATLFRHIPLNEACSRCMPNGQVASTPAPACATGSRASADGDTEDDIALPFLSYAAGLMTAAEIAKLTFVGKTVTCNRVFFESRTPHLVRAIGLAQRSECICRRRNIFDCHEGTIKGSRFASLSTTQ